MLIIRANVEISDAPLGQDRADFTGTLDQIARDVAATRKLGAAELLFDVQFSPGVETADDICPDGAAPGDRQLILTEPPPEPRADCP